MPDDRRRQDEAPTVTTPFGAGPASGSLRSGTEIGDYRIDAPLGAGETTAARLINEPGDAQRRMRAFDDEFCFGMYLLYSEYAVPEPGTFIVR